MRFFRMLSPEYHSDSQDLHINGNLEHVYRLPGVTCEACKATYGGSRILSISAPPQIKNDKRFMSRWPISDEEHVALQKEVAGYLQKDFVSFVTFRPGDNFQPAYLDIPSKPEADFLWPNIRSFVVSEKMKKLVFDELTDHVDIVPVQLRKVGNSTAKKLLPPNGNEADKPEAIINDRKPIDSDDSIGPYYQILVRSESDYPKRGSPVSICSVCKREAIEEEKRELVMTEAMWRGQQIFFLRTTLYVVVTEPLAEKITRAQASNVTFVPF